MLGYLYVYLGYMGDLAAAHNDLWPYNLHRV